MASRGLPAESPIPLSSGEMSKFCHKCKRLLPISFFAKNGTVLKTCFECRDSCQRKKRARRRELAEINQRLINDPNLNRVVVENNNGPRHNPSYTLWNPAVRNTDDVAKIIDHVAPYPVYSSPEQSIIVSAEEEGRPIAGKHIIMEALDAIRNEVDKISSCLAKTNPVSDSSKEVDSPSYTDNTSPPDLTESDYDSGIGEMTDEEGSEVSDECFFICIHCEIPRSVGLRYDGVCVYCLEQRQRFCVEGKHEADSEAFFDKDGDENDVCNSCLAAIRSERTDNSE